MAEGKYPIIADLGDKGGQLSFNSDHDVREFLAQERNRLSFLQRNGGNVGSFYQLVFNDFQNAINEADRQRDNPVNHFNIMQSAVSQWASQCRSGKIVFTKSARGEFVLALASEHELKGHGAAAYLAKVAFNTGDPLTLAGAIQAILFELGLTGLEPIQAKLQAAVADWNSVIDRSKIAHDEQQNAFKTTISVMNQSASTELEQRMGRLDGIIADSGKELAESKDRFRDLEETYNSKLALEAPVQYWLKKERAHRIGAASWGTALIMVAVAIVVGALFLLPAWMEEPAATAATGPSTLPAVAGIAHTPTWKLSFLLVLVVVCVWAMRILSRLTLSNLHLATDAAHRSALIQTFLSLEKRGDVKDKERELLLRAVLRPSATGIIRDDGIPPSALALITGTGEAK